MEIRSFKEIEEYNYEEIENAKSQHKSNSDYYTPQDEQMIESTISNKKKYIIVDELDDEDIVEKLAAIDGMNIELSQKVIEVIINEQS